MFLLRAAGADWPRMVDFAVDRVADVLEAIYSLLKVLSPIFCIYFL